MNFLLSKDKNSIPMSNTTRKLADNLRDIF